MLDIKIKVPRTALDLIATKGFDGCWATYGDFLLHRKIKTIELFTFGMVITPIVITELNETVGHVTYWGDGLVTISKASNDTSKLVSVARVDTPPTADECIELWISASSEET